MRGKESRKEEKKWLSRITPAYAGKSFGCNLHCFLLSDHPRLCGEKLPPHWLAIAFARITPAYAGKSWQYLRGVDLYQDHPRLCGEKLTWY